MPTSSPLTADTLRIRNKATGRAMWLVTTDEGTLTTSEVNPDRGHCPDLLSVDPVASLAPAVFTTGTPTTTTFQFDGELGAGSTVAVTNAGVTGTVSTISAAGSMMVFQYTAATGDVLKFTVKSADGSKTARRLYTPATVTLGPAYVADSLTQTVFTHGWAGSATASFDRPLASLNVEIVDNAGANAGTLTNSISGSTVNLANIVVQPGASKIRFTAVTDTNGFSTGVIDVPITSQAATKPTLTSVSLSSFTYGIATPITVSFSETLQSFTPSINGSGATVTTTWVAGQATAQCSVTAAADSTQLTFAAVDNNDGGADTITHGITVVAPAQPVLNTVSVTTFTTGVAVSGIVATFDRELASIASITIASGGTATNIVVAGQTVTFDLTASVAADPGYLFFNDVVSSQNSPPVTRSWQITVTSPNYPVAPSGTTWHLTPDDSTVTVDSNNKLLNMKNIVTGVNSITSPGHLQYDPQNSSNAKSMVWDPSTKTLVKSEAFQAFYIRPSLTNSDWSLVLTYYYTGKYSFVQLFTTSAVPPGGWQDPSYFTKIQTSNYQMNNTIICNGDDPTVNQWHVTVITHRISEKSFSVHHDGVLLGTSGAVPNAPSGSYPGDLEYLGFFNNGNQVTFGRVGTIMLVPRIISAAEVASVTTSCLNFWQARYP